MSRLIDVDAAIDRYYAEYKKQDIYDGSQDRDWLKRCIDEAPTIEVEPVRHGRWVKRGQDIFCSECDEESGYTWAGASRYSDYCPNCGAKMDGDSHEA